MGADTFMVHASGTNAQRAFLAAKEDAYYEFGHGGYSGTIAEKDSIVTIPLPESIDINDKENFEQAVIDYAESLIDDEDRRIDDKWGPAGCIPMGDDRYLFFGWASS